MTNYEKIKTPEDLAYALVEQDYCNSCPYHSEGLCYFDAEKESINMYTACYNAAISWLKAKGKE